ncbi:MAG: family 43 glycosylhydrolase [Coprobacter sp.]|nr:family 43 glycosylhydrolase [Coprobacter sp.]
MKHKVFLLSMVLSLCLPIGGVAQTKTSFARVGSQDETVQDLFPGSHRARPVVADFTNNGHFDLFYAGQDLGGSTGWYLKERLTDTRWGDQGNGRYVNPILNADYSDPDVIRVGEKYYMICSEFHYMGMPVLESVDMVNWRIIGQVYDKIDFAEYDNMQRYGGGSWAPAIRHHDGKYWIYFCTPNEGLFMTTATDPAGPWAPLVNVKNVSGWEDPCPLWDDNGDAYLGRSQLGGGPIIIHKMSADGTRLLDDGVTVYNGPTAEGTKMFKKDGYYYLSIPEGGVSTGWQTMLRAENIYGPYEKKIVLEQGSTKVNGPHQGALVDTPEGEWWFYHFQSHDPQGRIVHLQPVTWNDGWPTIGQDIDGNGVDEPVKEWNIPIPARNSAVYAPQTSDDFDTMTTAIQWQINQNPVAEKWSLAENPGWLSLHAMSATKLREARNMFTQKTMGYYSEAHTKLYCGDMVDGQRAGLFCTGNVYSAVGVLCANGKKYLYVETDGETRNITVLSKDTVYLKAYLNENVNQHQLYFSLNNEGYAKAGEPYALQSSDWKGARVGLYSYNTQGDSGVAHFDYFRYDYDGPGGYVNTREDPVVYADWHVWNELAALVKNNGDDTFTLVQEYDADIQQTIWTNSLFFDYDNDGNLDLLIVGKGGDWRYSMSTKYALLYRNLGPEGDYMFRKVDAGFAQECDEMYFNTISAGDYDHDGFTDVLIMAYDSNNNRLINLYRNEGGSGRFSLQRVALPADSDTPGAFYGASNGSVMMGDLDNDGWLDIFYNGYSNVSRGIRIYKNMQNGTFRDITPANIAGSFESQCALSDIDGDGDLDILVTGHGDNWARYSEIYYNTVNPATGLPEFTLADTDVTGLTPMNKANLLLADFNNDGTMDLVACAYDGTNNLTRVYYQNSNGKFTLDDAYPIISIQDGGINMGDVDGDNNMDVVVAGYKGSNTGDAYAAPVRIYENRPADAGIVSNTPPSAPQHVTAVERDGKLHISWEPSTDDISAPSALRYNICVKNNETGRVWSLIPADLETGRVKVGTDLQTTLSSAVSEYVMTVPSAGSYTIGVQALDQSYAGSAFTFYTGAFSGVKEAPVGAKKLIRTDDGFMLSGGDNIPVGVFNIEGKLVYSGKTNTEMTIEAPGLYIVVSECDVFKYVK